MPAGQSTAGLRVFPARQGVAGILLTFWDLTETLGMNAMAKLGRTLPVFTLILAVTFAFPCFAAPPPASDTKKSEVDQAEKEKEKSEKEKEDEKKKLSLVDPTFIRDITLTFSAAVGALVALQTV